MKTKNILFGSTLLAAAALNFCAASANADTYTWAGTDEFASWNTTDDNWTADGISTTWVNSSSNDATFTGDATNQSVTIDGSISAHTVEITSGSYTFTLGESGSLSANAYLKVDDGASLTIDGSGSVKFTSNATIGSNASLTIEGGSFSVNGSVTVKDGGSIEITDGNVLFNSTTTINSGASLTISGGSLTTNYTTTINSGATLTVSDDASLTVKYTTVNGGSIEITGGDAWFQNATNISNGGSLTITGGETTFSGATGVTVSGTDSSINIEGGSVSFNRDVTLSDGASIDISGEESSVSFNKDVILGEGTSIEISNGSVSFNGDVTLGDDASINISGGSVEFNGSIDLGTNGSLNISGGSVTLAEGASFTLSGTINLSEAIQNSGEITVDYENVTLVLNDSLLDEGKNFTYTFITNDENGTITDWGSLTADNFVYAENAALGEGVGVIFKEDGQATIVFITTDESTNGTATVDYDFYIKAQSTHTPSGGDLNYSGFEGIGIMVGGEVGDFTLTGSDGSEISDTNIYITGTSEDGSDQLTITSINIESSTNKWYGGLEAFIVENATVILDGGVSEENATTTIDTGNLDMTLCVGTLSDATLEITGGARITFNGVWNTLGSNLNTGTINISGEGSYLCTQQISIGMVYVSLSSGPSVTSGYYFAQYLESDDERDAVVAAVTGGTTYEGSYGIINVTEGGTYAVGVGNTDPSNNRLQLSNGEINIDGTGSSMVLGSNSSIFMMGENGLYVTDADGENMHIATGVYYTEKITVKNGGKVVNEYGTSLRQAIFGDSFYAANTTVEVSVEGEGSTFDIAVGNDNAKNTYDYALFGSVYGYYQDFAGVLGGNGDTYWGDGGSADVSILASDGGTFKVSAQEGIYAALDNAADYFTKQGDYKGAPPDGQAAGHSYGINVEFAATTGGTIELEATNGSDVVLAAGSAATGYSNYVTVSADGTLTDEDGNVTASSVTISGANIYANAHDADNVYVSITATNGGTITLTADSGISPNSLTPFDATEGTGIILFNQNTSVFVGSGSSLALSGAVSFSAGSSLTVNAGGTWTSTGSISVAEGATMSLSGTIDLDSTIANEGSITLGDNVVFVLNDALATEEGDSSTTYTFISGGTITGWRVLDYSNFVDSNGEEFSHGHTILNVSVAGSVTITEVAADLVWNGDETNSTWTNTTTTKNWLASDGSADYFADGDSVTFAASGEKSVTISGDIEANSVTVSGSEYEFSIGSGYSLTANTLTIDSGASLEITGEESSFTVSSTATIDGSLTIGENVTAEFKDDVYVGYFGNGELTISGGSTTFKGDVYVGDLGTGTLTITDGETTFEKNVYIGDLGTGTVEISGDNTTFVGEVRVGDYGKGSLTISGTGSTEFKDNVYIGDEGTGTLTISSDTTFDKDVYVGYYGHGELTITSDSTEVTGAVTVATDSSLTVSENGSLEAGSLTVSGTAEVAGTTEVTGALSIYGTLTLDGTSASLSADSASVSGKLDLTNGTAEIDNDLTISSTGSLSVATGASLEAGSADISGKADVAGSLEVDGALSVEGMLTVEGSLTASSTTVSHSGELYINISGEGTADLGAVTVNRGTLDVSAGTVSANSISVTNYGFASFTGESTSVKVDGSVSIDANSTLTVGTGTSLSAGSANVSGLLSTAGTTTINSVTVDLTGTLSITGGSLEITGDLTSSGTISVGKEASLSLDECEIDLSSAITNSGTVTVTENVSFVLNDTLIITTYSDDDDGVLYTFITSGGEIEGWDSLTYSNFIIDGEKITSARQISFNTDDGSIIYYADATPADLVWNGTEGDNSVWADGSTGDLPQDWLNGEREKADAFYNGDNVTFNGDAAEKNVTISGEIVAGSVTVTGEGYTFTFADDPESSLTADSLTVDGGSLTISSGTTEITSIDVSFGGSLTVSGGSLTTDILGVGVGSSLTISDGGSITAGVFGVALGATAEVSSDSSLTVSTFVQIADSGKLTISGGSVSIADYVLVYGNDEGYSSSIEVTDGKLTIGGEEGTTGSGCLYIHGGTVAISGGEVEVTNADNTGLIIVGETETDSSLTVSGTGSLSTDILGVVLGAKAEVYDSGSLTVSDLVQIAGGSLSITGGTVSVGNYVLVYSDEDVGTSSLTISGGKVTIGSDESDSEYEGLSIFGSTVSISDNAEVEVTGIIQVSEGSTLSISGGSLSVSDYIAVGFEEDIVGGSSLEITGGKVTIGSEDTWSGITGLYIQGGTLAISGNDTEVDITGDMYVNLDGSATIEGGSVSVSGDLVVGYDEEEGIESGSLEIKGGSVEVSGSATVSADSSISVSGTDTSVSIGNGLTSAGSISVGKEASLSLDEGEIDLSSAITNSGTVTVTENVTFVMNGSLIVSSYSDDNGGVLYTFISGSGSIDNWDDLTYTNFTINGDAITSARQISFNTDDGSIIYYADATPADLVWNGDSTNYVWADSSATDLPQDWLNGEREKADAFYNGDNVTFAEGEVTKSVTISGTVIAGTVTVTGTGYTFSFDDSNGADSSLTADTLTVDGGSLTISSGTTEITSIDVSFGGSLTVSGGSLTTDILGVGVGSSLTISDGGSITAGVFGVALGAKAEVYDSGSLTVSDLVQIASGSLSITGGTVSVGNYVLVYGDEENEYVGDGSLTISGGKVTIGSEDSKGDHVGLYVQDGKVEISGETTQVDIYGGLYIGYSDEDGTAINTGSLTISGGSTKVTGSATVSAGSTLSVTGGSLEITDGLTSAGTISVSSGAELTLGGTIDLSSAITNSGTVTLGDNVTFVLNAGLIDDEYDGEGVLYTFITSDGGTIDGWDSLTYKNFEIDGDKITSARQINFNTDDGSIIYNEDGAPADLVWNGKSTSNLWSDGTGTDAPQDWMNGSRTDAFYAGDNVTFADVEDVTKDVTISGEIVAGSVTVTGEGYTFTFADDPESSLTADSLTVTGENASLEIKDGTTTIAGAVTVDESGSLAISGGTTDIAGAVTVDDGSSLTVSGGTLNVVSITGEGSVTFGDGLTVGVYVGDVTKTANGVADLTIDSAVTLSGAVTFNAKEDETIAISGSIGGEGSLTKTGEGTLTVSGDNSTYSGDTTISAGTLVAEQISALGSGDVAIAEEATLELAASGTFSNATSGLGTMRIANNAKVSFGDSGVGVQTLEVASGAKLSGATTLTSDEAILDLAGTLALDIEAGETVSFTSTGKVILEDTAKLDLSNTSGLDAGSTFIIVDGGTIDGDVANFLATDDALLTLATTYAVAYDTSNGLRVSIVKTADASVIKGLRLHDGLGSDYIAAILDGEAALKVTPGIKSVDEIPNSAPDPIAKAILNGDTSSAERMLNTLAPDDYAAMIAMPTTSFHNDVNAIDNHLAAVRKTKFDENNRWGSFAQVQGTFVDNDDARDTQTFDFDLRGIIAGLDYRASKTLTVGATLGYDRGKAEIHHSGGKIESDYLRLTAYAGAQLSDIVYANIGAQFGMGYYDAKRKTALGRTDGDTSGVNAGVFADVGMDLPISEKLGLSARPYVGVAFIHSVISDFDDDLFEISSFNGESFRTRIGCGFFWDVDLGEMPSSIGFDVSYAHDFCGKEVDIDATYRATDRSFGVTAKTMTENFFTFGPVFSIGLTEDLSAFAGYSFQTGTDSSIGQNVYLGIKANF